MPKYSVVIKTVTEVEFEINASNMTSAVSLVNVRLNEIRTSNSTEGEKYFDEVVIKTVDTRR